MSSRTITVAALGTVAGAVLGIMALAFIAGLVITGTVTATLISSARSIARSEFVASAGAMYTLVIVAGMVVGLLISATTVALMRFLHPEEQRFGLGVLELGGAIAGGILAYVGLRAGLGWGGEIVFDDVTGETIATLSVFRATLVAAGVGAGTGLVIALVVEWLSRPAVVGLEGEAWPASRPAFLKETMPAMAIPIIALATAAVLVHSFSQVLLAGADETVVVVTVFSVVAALILAVAAFIAAHPPSGGEPPEEQS